MDQETNRQRKTNQPTMCTDCWATAISYLNNGEQIYNLFKTHSVFYYEFQKKEQWWCMEHITFDFCNGDYLTKTMPFVARLKIMWRAAQSHERLSYYLEKYFPNCIGIKTLCRYIQYAVVSFVDIDKMLSPNGNLVYLHLILSNVRLPIRITIWHLLKTNRSLKYLKIEGGGFEEDFDLENISEGLEMNDTFETLDFARTDLTPISACHIGKMLTTNHSLKNLDISQSELSENGIEFIFTGLRNNTTLETLTLCDVTMTESGYKCIVIHIKELRDALKMNTTLKRLDLASMHLCRADQETIGLSLAINHSLVELWLNECEMGDTFAISMGNSLGINNSLQILELGGGTITNDGCISICNGLRVNKTLKKLNLCKHDIGIQGGIAIGEMLRVNCTLEKLNLILNKIQGAGCIAISEGLRKNRAIKTIQLEYNGLNKWDCQQIKENEVDIPWRRITSSENSLQVIERIKWFIRNEMADYPIRTGHFGYSMLSHSRNGRYVFPSMNESNLIEEFIY
jgi:hypothetical protein